MNFDESIVPSALDPLGSSFYEDPRVYTRADDESGEATDHDEPHPQADDNSTDIDALLTHSLTESGASLSVARLKKRKDQRAEGHNRYLWRRRRC